MKVQQVIVKNLNIEDRVMYVPPKKAFVSLKDHKDNFVNDPKCRLLNPTKVEIGKVSKQILSRVVNALRVKTKIDLWKNTDSCIEWFDRACVGLKSKPQTTHWFCSECVKSHH